MFNSRLFFIPFLLLLSPHTFNCSPAQLNPSNANGSSGNATSFNGSEPFPSIDQKKMTMAYGSSGNGASSNGSEPVPLIDQNKLEMMMVMNETRRKLGSFQICAPCTCCGGAKGYCLPSPCCYAINCNIPNRPFGFCSFTPRTCNCFACH